jgi:ABC-type sugar transport system permease subunit
VLPILAAMVLSFTDWNGIGFNTVQWIGFDNYARLFQDPLFWESLLHNLIVSLLVFVFLTGSSFLIAAIIHAGIRGGSFFRVIFFAPVVLSSVAVAMLSLFFFSPSQGLINEVLRAIGLGDLAMAWLGDPLLALPSIMSIYMLQNFGFSVLLFLSGFSQVSDELCEAAEVDGASQSRILWSIVLPSMRPIVTVVVLLGFINSFRLFDTVYVMTGGGPYHASDTLVTYLFGVAFGGSDVGYANAISFTLFLILSVIVAGQLWLGRDKDRASR